MSLAEYAPTAWTDYADSPDLEASFLNHIELGIEAVTDELIAFEAWAASHYQPVSAELTAISGLSAPGYVKRTGPGAYSVVASIPQTDVAGGPFLPLAAGAANPLTGTLHGTSLNFTGWTSDAPISVSMNYSNAYAHAITVANPSLTAGQRLTVDFGRSAANNQANFGFAYAGDGSTANKITLGLYGNNDLVSIAGTGVMTVRDLGTGFVRASSGALSSSALVAADIPSLDASKITTGTFADARIASATTWNAKLSTVTADATSRAANTFYAAPNGAAGAAAFRAIVAADVPTLNQNTTGSAAKWTTPRTLTIGATGKALDGSANVSWSLADIGAAAASSLASYLPLSGGTMNTGAQIATNKDITPSASANTNYALAPIVAQRSSNSGTTTVAAVGFHNLGVNAAALYYDAATSVFRYNRHTGNIVTIWDASNLTNLNQLTNGPGYITSAGSISGNAATATEAVNSTNLGGKNWDYFVQGNGAGPYGHRTAEVSSFNTLLPSGFYDNRNGISPLTTGWTHMIRSSHSDPSSGSATWSFDIAANFYTPISGHQEGYYVRVNEGSNWGTWRTLWHSGNLSASTLPGGPYLPTAAGSVHSPGAYSNTGPTLLIGDWQYGLSANGGNLQLWAAPGGYVATTANLWANGAIGSGVSLSAGGGIMRAYNSGAYGIWGTGVADNNSAFSIAADNNGAWAWINGTSQSGLVVGGVGRAVASASGLAVTGNLSATGALSWGGAGAIPSSDYVVQGNGGGVLGHRTTNISGATATPTQSGFYDFENPADGPQGAVWTHMIRSAHTGNATSNQWMFDIAAAFGPGTGGVEGYYVRTTSAGSTPGWRQLWHSGNLTSATLPGGPYLPLAGGTVTGLTTFSAGFTVPQSAVASFGTSEIHREASYMGLWGKGVPWQFGRGYTVYTSPNNVSATFNEGIDCLRGVWTDSLFVRTEFYPSSTKWSSTSNYTLPIMAPGEQRVIFINAIACSVYANGSQTVNYRSFSTGDMRQAAVNARVDSAGSFGYGSTTTVHSFLLVCLDSSRVTLIC